MKLTTKEIAFRVNKTPARITQLIYDNLIQAEKIGRDWLIDEDQIAVINNLPDNRGKYIRKKRIGKITANPGEVAA